MVVHAHTLVGGTVRRARKRSVPCWIEAEASQARVALLILVARLGRRLACQCMGCAVTDVRAA